MILLLLTWLEQIGFRPPHVLAYYSTRMLLACATALLIWMLMGPRFIKMLYEWKVGQKIRMKECPLLGQLHEKKRDTPTMGGALILLALAFSSLLWMDLSHLYTWLLLLGTLSLGALGAYDDLLKLKWKNTKGLSARKKLMGQLGVGFFIATCLLLPVQSCLPLDAPIAYEMSQAKSLSLLPLDRQSPPIHKAEGYHAPIGDSVSQDSQKSTQSIVATCESGYPTVAPGRSLATFEFQHLIYFPGFKTPFVLPINLWVFGLLTLFFCFVITGSSNSVNLTDGLDGLAAGSIILTALCLIVAAFISNNMQLSNYLNWLYIEGSGEVAIFLCAMIGALLGFLWFNCYPAQVFMGDTGSLGLGGSLGIAAILLRREFFFALAAGVFVIEALSVILQVWSMRRYKQRIFLCSPLHHHFEYKGWPETKVVIRFWIVGLLFAIAALITIKMQ